MNPKKVGCRVLTNTRHSDAVTGGDLGYHFSEKHTVGNGFGNEHFIAMTKQISSWKILNPLFCTVSSVSTLNQKINIHQQLKWDLTNGPLSKLLELLNTQV